MTTYADNSDEQKERIDNCEQRQGNQNNGQVVVHCKKILFQ